MQSFLFSIVLDLCKGQNNTFCSSVVKYSYQLLLFCVQISPQFTQGWWVSTNQPFGFKVKGSYSQKIPVLNKTILTKKIVHFIKKTALGTN